MGGGGGGENDFSFTFLRKKIPNRFKIASKFDIIYVGFILQLGLSNF